MSKRILLLNGPNLNLLGERQPEIYGYEGMEGLLEHLRSSFKCELEYFQSNQEGDLIDKLHNFKDSDGVILNAGGLTHTSIALADAVAAINAPVIEVHISNIYSRESFRSKSYISLYAKGVISGLGLQSYEMALRYLLS
jgi:3-dehydroquinate dehydratase-2